VRLVHLVHPLHLTQLVAPLKRYITLNDLGHDPSLEARQALDRVLARAKRTSGLTLPHAFLRDDTPTKPPPLAHLLQGGGEVRIKLLLLLVFLLGAKPYSYEQNTPASRWALALGLADPATRGARRVTDAFQWLHDHGYLQVQRKQGRPPTFTLLSLRGTSKPYSRARTPGRFLTVPMSLWSHYWIMILTGAELAILLILIDGQRGATTPAGAFVLTGSEKARYALSDDTWTRGTKGLLAHGLITVKSAPHAGVDGWDFTRTRNSYYVQVDHLATTSTSIVP
jgi:hypothetical protein